MPQARRRLGAEPLKALLDLTGAHWAVASAAESRWRGLSLFAADGLCMRLPDTDVNEKEFGRPGTGRELSGYPQARIVALMAVRSHLIVGANCAGLDQGETNLIQPLLDKLPDDSLTILDRGFISWNLAHLIRSRGPNAHWLMRLKKGLKWTAVKKLGPGDELVEIEIRPALRREHPELPERFQARIVGYRVRGYRPQKLITSLLDPDRFPRKELAAVYHERWEIELGYDEIKTHMLERAESVRSKTPAGVRQEIAGILVAYNLVRQAMRNAASEVGVDPRRISFRNALLSVRNFCVTAWLSAPGTLPKRLIGLESDLGMLVLPERRRHRRYARTVKIKLSGYARNKRRGSARLRSRAGGAE